MISPGGRALSTELSCHLDNAELRASKGLVPMTIDRGTTKHRWWKAREGGHQHAIDSDRLSVR
jgi:hypothetical protein